VLEAVRCFSAAGEGVMLSSLRYQWQIWQLNRELDRIEKRYRPTREAEKGTVANAAPWSSEEGQATYTVMNRTSVLETADLLRRAAREKVPHRTMTIKRRGSKLAGAGIILVI
jgi:hypothetical protein